MMAFYRIIPDPNSIYKELKLYVNDEAKYGKCLMTEDGLSCLSTVYADGFCLRHFRIIMKTGLLNRYANLNDYPKYEVNGFDTGDLCHMVERGVECKSKWVQRKLCVRHLKIFRTMGKVNMYGAVKDKNQ